MKGVAFMLVMLWVLGMASYLAWMMYDKYRRRSAKWKVKLVRNGSRARFSLAHYGRRSVLLPSFHCSDFDAMTSMRAIADEQCVRMNDRDMTLLHLSKRNT